jgi:hypothetical protein
MRKSGEGRHRRRLVVIAGVVLSLLWSMSVVSVSSAQAPGAVCVLKIDANGRLVGILVDQPDSVNSAVLLPEFRSIRAPVPCSGLSTLALAVANQEARNTAFSVELFTHEGESFCSKGSFRLRVNGGTGVTFADCQ